MQVAAHRGEDALFDACCAELRGRYNPSRRVIFVQPPQFTFDLFDAEVIRNRGYYAFPPTGLQCLARAIDGRGIDYEIVDLNYFLLQRVIEDLRFNEWSKERWHGLLDEALGSFSSSVVAVTCISVYNDVFVHEHPMTSVLDYLKKQDRHITIAGGPIATNEYRGYLERELCHIVVTREGENKINFILDRIFDEQRCNSPLKGIYYRAEGEIRQVDGVVDAVVPCGDLVDTYAKVPIERYCKVGSTNPFSRMAGVDTPFSAFQFNRGCRARCEFCGVPDFMGSGLRHYPVEDVLREIEYLRVHRGIRHFELLDDDFFGKGEVFEQAQRLLAGMVEINRKHGITWAAGNGLIAASLSSPVLELMRDSGCIAFRIGIESGDQKMQRRMRKPASLGALRKTARLLRGFPEIFVGGNYILGLFGEETFGEMLKTLRFSIELELDWSGFTTFQVTSRKGDAVDAGRRRRVASEFVPARDRKWQGSMLRADLRHGWDVFSIANDEIPSPEQMREIWFVFNFVSNYIYNKNFTDVPGTKFVSWLEAILLTYPRNGYIPLFLALSHLAREDRERARRMLSVARVNVENSPYWHKRFERFGLLPILDRFPASSEDARRCLADIRRDCHERIGGRLMRDTAEGGVDA